MSKTAPPAKLNSEVFVPSNGSLILRDNLANGFAIPTESHRKSGHLRRPSTMGGYRFGQLSMSSFFTRHNPHPRRVNHFKGLLDVPICTVNDFDLAKKTYNLEFPPNNYNRQILGLPTDCINVNSSKFPMDTLTGLHYFHPIKELPFGAKTPSGIATEPWRQELQQIAQAAGLTPREEEPTKPERKRTSQYSAETGRLIPPVSKGITRQSTRVKTQEQFINNYNSNQRTGLLNQTKMEDTVMMMLCQILQTEDVEAVQSWLGEAGDHEKNMVQELIKAALTGTSDGYNTQYPVQEYMVGLDGLPMTPDVGTVIGDNVQNRLSTANDDRPPVPEPSMRPPTGPGPNVEEVVSRIEQTSARLTRNTVLPPIAEAVNPPEVTSLITSTDQQYDAPKISEPPLQPISNKQESFNKALENITRQTLDNLSNKLPDKNISKFTRYPLTVEPVKPNESDETPLLRLSSASSQRNKGVSQSVPSLGEAATVWKPAEASVI